MAIQVSGTTVIGNDRALSSVNGLKTIGGVSILGSGDIAAGGGTETVVVSASDWTNTTVNGNISGGTNGLWGYLQVAGYGTSGNAIGSVTTTCSSSTNGHLVVQGTDSANFNQAFPNSVVGNGSSNFGSGNSFQRGRTCYFFKIDAGGSINFSFYRSNRDVRAQYVAL